MKEKGEERWSRCKLGGKKIKQIREEKDDKFSDDPKRIKCPPLEAEFLK